MNDDIEKKHKEMIEILEGISVDEISSDGGVSIQVGKKIFRFKELEIVPSNDIETRLRNEFRTLINSQQQKIREKINQKISQLMTMYNQKQNELDRKENELIRKYSNTAHMPEITLRHMNSGLSVCKADSNDSLYWIYKGTYNPKFINIDGQRKPLDQRIIARLKREMIILIRTKGATITGVSTRKVSSIEENFEHYHQAHPDCWGNWRYATSWKTVDDILRVAKDAEAVLESINRRSVAQRHPSDMPSIDTLENRHILDSSIENHPNQPIGGTVTAEPTRRPRGRPRTRNLNTFGGILPQEPQPNTDVWST